MLPEGKNNSIFTKFAWKQKPGGEYNLSYLEPTTSVRKISNIPQQNKSEGSMKIIDNTEKYKNEMIVMTEWGIGRIGSISTEGIAVIKIEGSEVEFPLSSLNTCLTVYLCILLKENCFWAEVKLGFDCSVYGLKKRVAQLIKCHPSQVVIVHGGKKIETNVGIFELGVYEKDVFLAVVKDPKEYFITRSKNHKTSNKNLNYNAIGFKVNEDITLTGIGLFKNNNMDIFYNLLIFEEEFNSNLKLIYTEKKVLVKTDKKENPIFKHKISNLNLKKDTLYQIHQYIESTDSNQNIGVKCSEEVSEKHTNVIFTFSNCKISGRTNSSDIEEGLVPSLYFNVKSL
jgi:hypothetical protein